MDQDTPRDVPWPGNQINGITAFREACYKKCHEENPTDSGWYEKVNACGQECKNAVKAYEYIQGKNPCQLRLQAPVFWFGEPSSSTSTHEPYVSPHSSGDTDTVIAHTTPMSIADVYPKEDVVVREWTWVDWFYVAVTMTVLVIVCFYMAYLLSASKSRKRR